MKADCWFVYIIENEKGHLYTGITTDLKRRLQEHGEGGKGAKFFRSSPPKEMVFHRKFPNRSEASKFEAKVKGLKRIEKLKLIQKRK